MKGSRPGIARICDVEDARGSQVVVNDPHRRGRAEVGESACSSGENQVHCLDRVDRIVINERGTTKVLVDSPGSKVSVPEAWM